MQQGRQVVEHNFW